nr:MAG TPA: hypothetical protein [Caudoviricetes sp.]
MSYSSLKQKYNRSICVKICHKTINRIIYIKTKKYNTC